MLSQWVTRSNAAPTSRRTFPARRVRLTQDLAKLVITGLSPEAIVHSRHLTRRSWAVIPVCPPLRVDIHVDMAQWRRCYGLLTTSIRFPCHYGMDFPTPDELIANQLDGDVKKIGQRLGVDSLEYLSIEDLLASVPGENGANYCTACFSGKYPVKVDTGQSKDENEA